jgi:hypothetical protein
MAKYRQLPTCTKCGYPARVSIETVEGELHQTYNGDYTSPPKQWITVDCQCGTQHLPVKVEFIKPIAKESTVTEKQYSTEPAKNDALKAVNRAFKTVEETLFTNAVNLLNLEQSSTSLLTNSLNRLDKTLLEAGQAGVLFDDLTTAFPADATVLTNRLEAVWEMVKLDNLEGAV